MTLEEFAERFHGIPRTSISDSIKAMYVKYQQTAGSPARKAPAVRTPPAASSTADPPKVV